MTAPTTRRNRQTGTIVTVASAYDCYMDAGPENRWYTICEDHGTTCAHSTRKLADSFAASPRDWCEGCQP